MLLSGRELASAGSVANWPRAPASNESGRPRGQFLQRSRWKLAPSCIQYGPCYIILNRGEEDKSTKILDQDWINREVCDGVDFSIFTVITH
jgi:hypothetical protein